MLELNNSPRVLVIDDSKLMRLAIKKALGDEFIPVEADNGELGWNLLCSNATFQVVITDALMPGIDGYELTRRIRSSDNVALRSLPILMITGVDEVSARERALQAGATDFITKPFDKTQLQARIRGYANAESTNRKLVETSETLAVQGSVDALTGISSRRYFINRGTQDLSFCTRHGQDLSVIILNVDGYTELQKKLNPEIKNKLLVWVAKKLKESVRAEDTVARLDGATFAIIANAAGRLEAVVLCERARKALLLEPWSESGDPLAITGSLGLVSLNLDKVSNIEAMLALASIRAERAQAEGGNHIVAADAPLVATGISEPEPGIEAALQLVAAGNLNRLHPHFLSLLRRVMPLFDAANTTLNLGLSEQLATIKTKLPTA